MSSKEQVHDRDKTTSKRRLPRPDRNSGTLAQQLPPATAIQQARLAPSTLSARSVLQLQRTIGNRAVVGLSTKTKQRAKPIGSLIQRVKVKVGEEEKELSTLSVGEMKKYLIKACFREKGLSDEEKQDVATWIKNNYAKLSQKERKIIEGRLTSLYPEVIPEAIKDFKDGTVQIKQDDIEKAIGGEKEQVGDTGYCISVSSGSIKIHYGNTDLGIVTFSIEKSRIGVQTINIHSQYQGQNLSRFLMAVFCIYGRSKKATNWELKTEDTSKGWWAQWGSSDLATILKRGDMTKIHLPRKPKKVKPKKITIH
jgi:hypothetical protein